MSDTGLAKAHARAELEALHAEFKRPLLSYFFKRVGTLSEAEDLTQEVFYKLLRRSPREAIGNPAGFVFAAAANLLRDRVRHRLARPSETELPNDAEGWLPQAVIEDISADRVLVGREQLAQVLACLDELPPRTRDVFLAFRVERMKQKELARAMGISVSAVEKHIMRASAHLASRFGPEARR